VSPDKARLFNTILCDLARSPTLGHIPAVFSNSGQFSPAIDFPFRSMDQIFPPQTALVLFQDGSTIDASYVTPSDPGEQRFFDMASSIPKRF
jgi:hypothetical protein